MSVFRQHAAIYYEMIAMLTLLPKAIAHEAMFGWILLFAFWGSVVLLFINVGWKPALTFVGLWFAGLFLVLPLLGAPPVAGLVYQAVLTIPLVIWVKQVTL